MTVIDLEAIIDPTIRRRDVDREARKVEDSLAEAEDLDLNVDTDKIESQLGRQPAGGGGGGRGRDRSQRRGGRRGGVGGMAAGVAGGGLMRLVTGGALAVSLKGIVGIGLLAALGAILSQLGLLTPIIEMLSSAMRIFFRPMGMIIGVLFGGLVFLIEMARRFIDWLDSGGLGDVFDSLKELAWEDFIQEFVWSSVIKEFLWNSVIKEFLWNSVIKEFLWNSVITEFIWNSVIKEFLWGSVIKEFVWNSVIKEFVWNSVIKEFVWESFIQDLIWESFIKDVVWAAFVGDLTWSGFVNEFLWSSVIKEFVWQSFIRDLVWGSFVRDLVWQSFIRDLVWRSFIRDLIWRSFIVDLVWRSFIRDLLWQSFIRDLVWRSFVRDLIWRSFVRDLVWRSFLRPLIWDNWIARHFWSNYVPRVNWRSWIPDVDWSDFIPEIDTSTDSRLDPRNWNIRGMASGGLVKGPMPAVVGEDGDEVVAPYDSFISTLDRERDRALNAASAAGATGGGLASRVGREIAQTIDSSSGRGGRHGVEQMGSGGEGVIEDRLKRVERAIKNLDTDITVEVSGEQLLSAYDKSDGRYGDRRKINR